MLELQQQLKVFGIDAICEKYHLRKSNSRHFPIFSLCYHQVDSDLSIPLVQQARGIIFDNDLNIIAYPFNKFFNLHESNAAKLNNYKVVEKLDGTCVVVSYYQDNLIISTLGSVDTGFIFHSKSDKTYKTLFKEVFAENNYDAIFPGFTYCFELVGNCNPHIVQYKENDCVLTFVRDNNTLEEIDPFTFVKIHNLNWRVAKTFNYTLEECKQLQKSLSGVKSEGFILVDENFNRVKIKTESYIRLHYLHNSINTDVNLLNVIIQNETSEILCYFPQFTERIHELKSKYEKLLHNIKDTYNLIKDIEIQKEFALEATKYPYSSFLFNLRKGYSLESCINNCLPYKLLELLK